MKVTKKQKIRLEKIERLILPNAFQQFCPICQFEQICDSIVSLLLHKENIFSLFIDHKQRFFNFASILL